MNVEQQMKEALEGRFFSMRMTDYGMQFFEKKVSVNFTPCYSFTNPNIAGAKRGAESSALVRAQRSASFWTPALLAELRERRAAGTGTKKISREMNIPLGEVRGQLKRMKRD